MCVSEFFFFICFVVVLVGRARASESLSATLRVSVTQLIVDARYSLLVVDIVNQSLAEYTPHAFEHGRGEMKSFIQTFVRA